MVQEFTKSGFVDGVLELHKQLNSAFESAVSIASKTGIISADEAKNILERKRFQIFVNPNETQPENGFKGYFKFRNMICRFLEVIFDYALLFPVRDHRWSNANNYSKGITYNEIQELIRNRAPFTLQFMRIEEERPGSDEMLPDNINLFRVVLGKKSFSRKGLMKLVILITIFQTLTNLISSNSLMSLTMSIRLLVRISMLL